MVFVLLVRKTRRTRRKEEKIGNAPILSTDCSRRAWKGFAPAVIFSALFEAWIPAILEVCANLLTCGPF